jgi:hypothetical protein
MSRPKVLWAGERPDRSVEVEFKNRDLLVEFIESPPSLSLLAASRGVVYRFGRSSLTTVRNFFRETVAAVADHGLAVYMLADDDVVQGHIDGAIGDISGKVRRRTAPIPVHEIAEFMARHDPGRAYDERLQITHDPNRQLTPTQSVLLKRAFSDCAAIRLRSLDGGLSANVFEASATFRDSQVGPRPLTMFVKFDKTRKIAAEKSNYSSYASHFIPFHLRPNIDFTRCIEGSELGILAGNFVDHSESLWDVARRGHARQALHCLFEDALWGWRLQAFTPGAKERSGPVAAALRPSAYEYERSLTSYVGFAEARYGIRVSPIELWERLIGLEKQRYRVAPMHGDLHGHNVRVRRGEAILIDLAMTTNGPVVADPAALEVWLACEPPPADEIGEGDEAWRVVIDEFYSPERFREPLPPTMEPSAFDWLRDSVRQIRSSVADIQLCEGEYQTAVAVYLLRRTMFPARNDRDAFRRGYAYVVASRLVQDLVDRERNACAPVALS